MGINDDVVAAVGREVGSRYPPKIVEDIGEYLRANSGEMYEENGRTWTDQEKGDFERIIDEIYEESGDITEGEKTLSIERDYVLFPSPTNNT